MMSCNEVEPLLVDLLDGQLSSGVRTAVQQHVGNCAACREALNQYRQMFQTMSAMEEEVPGPGLQDKFDTMLQSELNIHATTTIVNVNAASRTPVIKTYSFLLKVAACIALVTAGIFIGKQLTGSTEPSGTLQMSELQKEVREMKETMMLNLLSQESASERIKAVNYVEGMNKPDQKVIHALIHTLNNDENVNVRLAALSSVSKFSSDPKISDSLLASLGKQTEPIMQIVLIKIFTDQKESKAIGPIRKILQNEQTLQPVKDMAEKGLKTL
jgi:hypothetical protein